MKHPSKDEQKQELTETEVVRLAQQGDAAAFESLYKSHSRRVYAVCLRMLKNPSDAEDVTQQVFLQLFRKIGAFRGDSALSTWLHRLTVNAVLMHIRRRKPEDTHTCSSDHATTEGEAPRELESGDDSMLGAIDRINLFRAIRQLPSGSKQHFVMHDVIGFKHVEIAKFLGCSVGCSKSQLHKARKRLRELLERAQIQTESHAVSA